MRHRLLALLIAAAVAVAIVIAIPKLAAVFGRGLDPAKTAKATTTTDGVALKTAWGDPDHRRHLDLRSPDTPPATRKARRERIFHRRRNR